MRIKLTALVLSALLPLGVFAATDAPVTTEKTAQQEQRMQDRQQMMQKRQAAWFDELKLTADQRAGFQQEMQHREQQQAARTAHHDKLRGLLTAEQQVEFDKKVSAMQNNMHKKQKMYRSGKSSRTDCQDTKAGKRAAQ